MARLIDADRLILVNDDACEKASKGESEFVVKTLENFRDRIDRLVNAQPTVDAVPVDVLQQVRWERDIAIGQLSDIGKSLGERMDDVAKVVRCKDCIHAEVESCPDGLLWCNAMQTAMLEEEYCSHGERIEP